MTDLYIEKYSDKSFVVRGDTKHYKEQLSAMCGRYNPNLKGGEGWVFSTTRRKEEVTEWLDNLNKTMREAKGEVQEYPKPIREYRTVLAEKYITPWPVQIMSIISILILAYFITYFM